MLVPSSGEAGDDERDLWQPAEPKVVEVIALAAPSALVVRPSLPEDKDVVSVPERHAVPADVVNLPRHAGSLEEVEDDRVVEDSVAPDAVGRDATGSSGREVEPVRPRRAEDRAEVVAAEREVVEQAVVVGKLCFDLFGFQAWSAHNRAARRQHPEAAARTKAIATITCRPSHGPCS